MSCINKNNSEIMRLSKVVKSEFMLNKLLKSYENRNLPTNAEAIAFVNQITGVASTVKRLTNPVDKVENTIVEKPIAEDDTKYEVDNIPPITPITETETENSPVIENGILPNVDIEEEILPESETPLIDDVSDLNNENEETIDPSNIIQPPSNTSDLTDKVVDENQVSDEIIIENNNAITLQKIETLESFEVEGEPSRRYTYKFGKNNSVIVENKEYAYSVFIPSYDDFIINNTKAVEELKKIGVNNAIDFANFLTLSKRVKNVKMTSLTPKSGMKSVKRMEDLVMKKTLFLTLTYDNGKKITIQVQAVPQPNMYVLSVNKSGDEFFIDNMVKDKAVEVIKEDVSDESNDGINTVENKNDALDFVIEETAIAENSLTEEEQTILNKPLTVDNSNQDNQDNQEAKISDEEVLLELNDQETAVYQELDDESKTEIKKVFNSKGKQYIKALTKYIGNFIRKGFLFGSNKDKKIENNIKSIKTQRVIKYILDKLKRTGKYIVFLITGYSGLFSMNVYGDLNASPISLSNLINNTAKNAQMAVEILPEIYQQQALRGLNKLGLYNVEEETVEMIPSFEVEKVEKNNEKPEAVKYSFYKQYQKVKDNFKGSGKTDSLYVYERQSTNEEGFSYIPGPTIENSKSTNVINKVSGVGHFLITYDNADLTSNTSDLKLKAEKNRILEQYKAQNPNGWIPVFKKLNKGVVLSFKKLNEINENDIVMTRLYQRNFGDLNFEEHKRSSKLVGGKRSIIDENKNQSVDQLQFTKKEAYGRLSGGSAIFIFNVNGKTIIREAAGSVSFLEQVGKNIANQYKLNKKDITMGFFDAGSYAAKPAAYNNNVVVRQYEGYGSSNATGASLMIPTNGISTQELDLIEKQNNLKKDFNNNENYAESLDISTQELDLIDELEQLPKDKLKNLYDITDVKLSQLLIEYLKPFGVTFEAVENLNNKGYNNVYIIDTLSKLAKYQSGELSEENIADAAGHIIFELIGRNSYLGKLLLGKIADGERTYKTKTIQIDGSDYEMPIEMVDRYSENKTKFPNMSDGQILIHTAGNIISDSLKENKRKSSSFLQKVYDAVQSVISSLFGGKVDTIGEQLSKTKNTIFGDTESLGKNLRMSTFSLQELADFISASVLLNKDTLLDITIPKDFVHHDFEYSMNNSPELKNIHSRILNSQYKDEFGLVGSVAFRKVGTVYRHKDELVHDIDYLTSKNISKNFDNIILQIFPNAIKSHNDWNDARTKANTITYLIPLDVTDKIVKYNKSEKENGYYSITDPVTSKEGKCVSVDFFVPNEDNIEEINLEEGVTRFDGSFIAKINYGRPKDLKDFRNFKLFNPSKNTALFQNESFKFTNITGNEIDLLEKQLIKNNELNISCKL